MAVDVVKQHQRLGEYFNRHDMPYEDPNLHNVSLLQSNDLMYLCEMFLRIAMSAWILCALFLLIRIVTVVDFQLVRITVRTVEVNLKLHVITVLTSHQLIIFHYQQYRNLKRPIGLIHICYQSK